MVSDHSPKGISLHLNLKPVKNNDNPPAPWRDVMYSLEEGQPSGSSEDALSQLLQMLAISTDGQIETPAATANAMASAESRTGSEPFVLFALITSVVGALGQKPPASKAWALAPRFAPSPTSHR